MPTIRLRPVVAAVLLGASVLGGCQGPNESREIGSTPTTLRRAFSYDTDMYRVEVEQYERDGTCLWRSVVFLSHSQLYTKPHVDRVRGRDEGCDATNLSAFEDFAIMRSPEQQELYQYNFAFRSRVEEDLWDAYQQALFNDEARRRRAQSE